MVSLRNAGAGGCLAANNPSDISIEPWASSKLPVQTYCAIWPGQLVSSAILSVRGREMSQKFSVRIEL